jgi:hypothetical protein
VPVQVADKEWVTFPGGELEGERPRALCPACRAALAAGRPPAAPRTLCFQCYRSDLDRQRALRAAADLDTASEARFQSQLPFEAVDVARLETLKVARAEVRQQRAGGFEDRRRRAQIDARHALQSIAANLRARGLASGERERQMADAVHAAELQLPEAWMPFVVSR